MSHDRFDRLFRYYIIALCSFVFIVLAGAYYSNYIPVGACLVKPHIDGGYYKILDKTKYSYITRAYGTYIRHGKKFPILVSKNIELSRIDCLEGDVLEKYMKHVTKEK